MMKKAFKQMEKFMAEATPEKFSGFHANFYESLEAQKKRLLAPYFSTTLTHEKPIEYEKPTHEIAREVRNVDLPDLFAKAIEPGYLAERKKLHFDRESELCYLLDLLICDSYAWANKTLPRTFEYNDPISGKKVRLQKGAKISKILKNFISNKTELDKIQTIYSQVLNEAKVKGVLCVSIDPLDYITASINKSNWSSCFNFINDGEYQASILSLLLSHSTMMVYIKSKEDVVYHEAGGLTWNNKKWRVFATLDEDLGAVHFGQPYPYHNEDILNSAVSFVQEIFNLNFEKNTRDNDDYYSAEVLCPDSFYNDCDYRPNFIAYTERWRLESEIESKYFDICEAEIICPKCGNKHHGTPASILCSDCSEICYCSCCDDRLYYDEMVETYYDGYVCHSCISEYYR